MESSDEPTAQSPQGASDPVLMDRLLLKLRLIFAMRYMQTDPEPVQLLDYLYIGSIGAAMNKKSLKNHGITHVLTVADKMTPMFPTEFTYLNIGLLDALDANLLEVLPQALEFIESARQQRGKILVHCFAGKSRSASVCIAYIMRVQRLNLLEALRYVRVRRDVVMPNTNFMQQLKQFEVSLGIAPGVES